MGKELLTPRVRLTTGLTNKRKVLGMYRAIVIYNFLKENKLRGGYLLFLFEFYGNNYLQ